MLKIIQLFQEIEGSCNPKPCGLGAVYQPSIPDDMQLFAVSVYFYVANVLGIIHGAGSVVEPIAYKTEAYHYCARVRQY